jgi:Ras-related GTP-binding protein A/B
MHLKSKAMKCHGVFLSSFIHKIFCSFFTLSLSLQKSNHSEIVTNLIPNISVLESHLDDFCRICDADEVVLFERATFLVISQAHSQKGGGSNTTNKRRVGDANDTENDGHKTTAAAIVASPQGDSTNTVVMKPTQERAPATTSPTSPQQSIIQRQPRSKSPQFDAHRFEKISNIVKQFKLSCGKTQSQFAGMEVRNSKFSAFIDAFTANTYIMVIVSDPSIHTATTLLNIKNAKSHFERFIPRS